MTVLRMDSWAGREEVPCIIVGETRTRYRIKLLKACRLPNRREYNTGDVVLVPKYAVRQQDTEGSVA